MARVSRSATSGKAPVSAAAAPAVALAVEVATVNAAGPVMRRAPARPPGDRSIDATGCTGQWGFCAPVSSRTCEPGWCSTFLTCLSRSISQSCSSRSRLKRSFSSFNFLPPIRDVPDPILSHWYREGHDFSFSLCRSEGLVRSARRDHSPDLDTDVCRSDDSQQQRQGPHSAPCSDPRRFRTVDGVRSQRIPSARPAAGSDEQLQNRPCS